MFQTTNQCWSLSIPGPLQSLYFLVIFWYPLYENCVSGCRPWMPRFSFGNISTLHLWFDEPLPWQLTKDLQGSPLTLVDLSSATKRHKRHLLWTCSGHLALHMLFKPWNCQIRVIRAIPNRPNFDGLQYMTHLYPCVVHEPTNLHWVSRSHRSHRASPAESPLFVSQPGDCGDGQKTMELIGW